jgi:hypothetical protein
MIGTRCGEPWRAYNIWGGRMGLVEIGALAGAVMGVVALGAWLKQVIDGAFKPLVALSSGVRVLLKSSIKRIHDESVKAGRIDSRTLELVLDMHKQYEALKGNGFIDELIADLKDLPIRED